MSIKSLQILVDDVSSYATGKKAYYLVAYATFDRTEQTAWQLTVSVQNANPSDIPSIPIKLNNYASPLTRTYNVYWNGGPSASTLYRKIQFSVLVPPDTDVIVRAVVKYGTSTRALVNTITAERRINNGGTSATVSNPSPLEAGYVQPQTDTATGLFVDATSEVPTSVNSPTVQEDPAAPSAAYIEQEIAAMQAQNQVTSALPQDGGSYTSPTVNNDPSIITPTTGSSSTTLIDVPTAGAAGFGTAFIIGLGLLILGRGKK